MLPRRNRIPLKDTPRHTAELGRPYRAANGAVVGANAGPERSGEIPQPVFDSAGEFWQSPAQTGLPVDCPGKLPPAVAAIAPNRLSSLERQLPPRTYRRRINTSASSGTASPLLQWLFPPPRRRPHSIELHVADKVHRPAGTTRRISDRCAAQKQESVRQPHRLPTRRSVRLKNGACRRDAEDPRSLIIAALGDCRGQLWFGLWWGAYILH